jgi:hypothetical protein
LARCVLVVAMIPGLALDACDPGRASGVTDPNLGSFYFLRQKGGMRMGKFSG